MVKSFPSASLPSPALCCSSAIGTGNRGVKCGVLDLRRWEGRRGGRKGRRGGEGTTPSHQWQLMYSKTLRVGTHAWGH